jgi:hypothetical protein
VQETKHKTEVDFSSHSLNFSFFFFWKIFNSMFKAEVLGDSFCLLSLLSPYSRKNVRKAVSFN